MSSVTIYLYLSPNVLVTWGQVGTSMLANQDGSKIASDTACGEGVGNVLQLFNL